jgi:3-deoxy-D-manno-octulosonate 8-phosphate phosphatase (KDO 8-P phosphatase)
MAETLADRCRHIELLVIDVDGVLTDGGIAYDDRGAERKSFHVRDGAAVRIWQMVGKRSAVLSGRRSPVVERRAKEMGVDRVIQGASEKLPAFAELLAQERLAAVQACFIGDDLPDLPVLRNCGLAVAVPDACQEVRLAAHFVAQTPGGKGAVRETVELILRCQGLWQSLVEKFDGQRL